MEIRTMVKTDAGAVAELSEVLGYKTSASDVARRFRLLSGRTDNALFVAVDGDLIVGWVHVCGVPRLQTDGYSEVGGIAVADSHRRRGIGARLIQECESWGSGAGYGRMRLRSGLQRSDAHLFYQSIGYAQHRASYSFERAISVEVEANAV